MTISLTESDKARVRHHMGYLQIEPAAAITLGFPSAQQALFLVESAMNRIIGAAVGIIQETLSTLDAIEDQMRSANRRLRAQQIDELKLRNDNNEPNENEMLREEYRWWAETLADDLGCPLNVYSYRFRRGRGTLRVGSGM